MIRKSFIAILIVVSALLVLAPLAEADENGMLGSLHEYAPFSFWHNAASFLDDPAMDEAFQAVANAASAITGKECYDADAVKDFFADMFDADFAAVAVNNRKTFTFYDADGAIQTICQYRYFGPETVQWQGFPVEWHKYKRVFCMPRPRKDFRQCWHTPYKYLVATPVHQHGDGMIHAHIRLGDTGFKDLMENPAYSMWWPTLALYGATTAASLAEDIMEEPEEFAFMLPGCSPDEIE
jgi:hypothetical protein